MGWLADRYPKKYVMILIYLLVAAGIPLLFFINEPGVIYLFAIVFGIGMGGDYMIIPLMAAELFGLRVMGRIMGLIIVADGSGGGVGAEAGRAAAGSESGLHAWFYGYDRAGAARSAGDLISAAEVAGNGASGGMITTENELEERLSRPTASDVEFMRRLRG
jgi:MFS family permease